MVWLVAVLSAVSCTGRRVGESDAVFPSEPAFCRMAEHSDSSFADPAIFDTLNRYAAVQYDGEYYESFVYFIDAAYARDPAAMLEWMAAHPDTERLSDWLGAALDMDVLSGERLHGDIDRLPDERVKVWLEHRLFVCEDRNVQ